ncbi:MAG TPA: hypothetical protein PKD64_18765 [Pirellulaceae bacterium]|nr:hypothetical protein [Pirellulaceae bacterium]HMO94233.1 hypothetical protein [Pirellulaceae bacterium]HMP71269.1 hypothetical protein [Pirellulaceae bacterium]
MKSFKWQIVQYGAFCLIAIICSLLLSALPVEYPHPSQEESLRVTSLLPILALGGLGVWLFSMTSIGRRQVATVKFGAYIQAMVWGLGFGLVAVGLDYTLEISKTLASVLDIKSIHLSAPYSILAYLAAAVVIETMFRLLPLGVVTFAAEKFGAKSRVLIFVFVVFAMLTAVVEPISQAGVFASRPGAMLAIAAFIYLYGLVASWQMWKTGPSACILMRIAFYLVWHVTLGPNLAA